MNPSNPNSGAQEFVEDVDWTVAPLRGRGFVIGAVDEVNGRGALAVPAFVPTRHELLLLYAHWAETKLDIEFSNFFFMQGCSRNMRIRPFARRRMVRIEEALGDDPALEAAIQEVETEFSATVSPLAWKVFTGKATEAEKRECEAMVEKYETGGAED